MKIISKVDGYKGPVDVLMDTTGASLLVMVSVDYGFLPSNDVITDNKGNTWNFANFYAPSDVVSFGGPALGMWYVLNPVVGPGHTVTVTGNYNAFVITAWSGVATISPYYQNNGSSSQEAISVIQTGAITPSADNELVISGASFENNPAYPLSIDSGMTISNQIPWMPTTAGLAVAYKIQTTAATINPTWTASSPNGVATMIASFKAANPSVPITLLTSSSGTSVGTNASSNMPVPSWEVLQNNSLPGVMVLTGLVTTSDIDSKGHGHAEDIIPAGTNFAIMALCKEGGKTEIDGFASLEALEDSGIDWDKIDDNLGGLIFFGALTDANKKKYKDIIKGYQQVYQ